MRTRNENRVSQIERMYMLVINRTGRRLTGRRAPSLVALALLLAACAAFPVPAADDAVILAGEAELIDELMDEAIGVDAIRKPDAPAPTAAEAAKVDLIEEIVEEPAGDRERLIAPPAEDVLFVEEAPSPVDLAEEAAGEAAKPVAEEAEFVVEEFDAEEAEPAAEEAEFVVEEFDAEEAEPAAEEAEFVVEEFDAEEAEPAAEEAEFVVEEFDAEEAEPAAEEAEFVVEELDAGEDEPAAEEGEFVVEEFDVEGGEIVEEAVIEEEFVDEPFGDEPFGDEGLIDEPVEGAGAAGAAAAAAGGDAGAVDAGAVDAAAAAAQAKAAAALVERAFQPTDVPEEIDLSSPEGVAMQEEVRRRAKDMEGRRNLKQGEAALANGEAEAAQKYFLDAVSNFRLAQRPQNTPYFRRAEAGQAAAKVQLAVAKSREATEIEDHKGAKKLLEDALVLQPENEEANRLLADIQRKIIRAETKDPIPEHPRNHPEFLEKSQRVRRLLRDGRRYYEIHDYANAAKAFDRALVLDPYNQDAMNWLGQVRTRVYQANTSELEATAKGMVADVRGRWSPPDTYEIERDDDPEKAKAGAVDPTQAVKDRLRTLIINELVFVDANIVDIVEFLVVTSRELDETGEGVSIVLNLPQDAAPAAPAADPFGGGFIEEEAFEDANAGGRSITLNLRQVSMHDALDQITKLAGLRWKIDGKVVVIKDPQFSREELVQKAYPVLPDLMDLVRSSIGLGGGGGGDFGDPLDLGGGDGPADPGSSEDLKRFFSDHGVPFPAGSSISYNQRSSKLFVSLPEDFIELFEFVLGELNVEPKQIEIEARFVEITQKDLEEIGAEWGLIDDFEIEIDKQGATRPLGGQRRLEIPANVADGGFTRGIRFLGGSLESPQRAGTISRLLTISSVLTNPELNFILHLLDQSGRANLLSAPRVTTKSGNGAMIKVVTEFIYPVEFEVLEGSSSIGGTGAGGTFASVIPVAVPSEFEMREVGVILQVTPTVGPDGYTIDLVLQPEVVSEPEWRDYGTSIPTENGEVDLRIEQPFFHTRTIQTSISIYDGATVVMGGMITENMVTHDDKIPFLGELPVIGRAFRSRSVRSDKRNLMIFVTARLVDPAGQPVRSADGEEATRPDVPEGAAAPIVAPAAAAPAALDLGF